MDDYACVPRTHIRSVRVYDQFNTISIIDAMWISDAVRTAYVDLYSHKHYLSPEHTQTMLENELKRNDRALGFYVLLWQQPKCGDYLEQAGSFWKVALVTETGSYEPRLIKRIDLPCEYVIFFGKRYNRFDRVYYIEFDGMAEDGKIIDKSSYMTLCFSSFLKKTFLRWNLSDGLLCDEPKENDCELWEKCDVCKELVVE